jgi:hypothetical protein
MSTVSDNLFNFYERSLELTETTRNFARISKGTNIITANQNISFAINRLHDNLFHIEENYVQTFGLSKARQIICTPIAPLLSKALDYHLHNDTEAKDIESLSKTDKPEDKNFDQVGKASLNLFKALDQLIRSRAHFTKNTQRKSKQDKETLTENLHELNSSIEKLSSIIKSFVRQTSNKTKDIIENELLNNEAFIHIKQFLYGKIPGIRVRTSELLGLDKNIDGTRRKKLVAEKKKQLPKNNNSSKSEIHRTKFPGRSNTDIVTYADGSVQQEKTNDDGTIEITVIQNAAKRKSSNKPKVKYRNVSAKKQRRI